MAVLTIPKVLREKLSDDGADALVDLINRANEKQKEDTLTFVEEKFEKRLTEVKADLEKEIGKVRTEIAEAKADLIKWVFVFMVGQFWAIVGTLFVFFRK